GMSTSPDAVPHRVYTVTLRGLDGTARTRRVVTNRGEAKAVYIATQAETGLLLQRFDALDVSVSDDGDLETGPDGVPILDGYGFDRNEW
ncbi:MAG: hypothetical protein AB7V44_35330, partial [Pseudonocardia sp.]